MNFWTSGISEWGNYSFNILLDFFLVLFLFSTIEDITVIVKLFTSLFILLVAIIRTYYYAKGIMQERNEKGTSDKN